jgi:hypothetical protein
VIQILKKSFWCPRKVKVHRLEPRNNEQRLDRSGQLLLRFPTDQSLADLVFSDEKVFELEHCSNKQNDRLYVPIGMKKADIPPEK